MNRNTLLFVILVLTFIASFFIPVYLTPEGTIIGYRAEYASIKGLMKGNPEAVLGAIANLITLLVIAFKKIAKDNFAMVALSSFSLLCTLSMLLIVESFLVENLFIGYWLWAFSCPFLVIIQHLRANKSVNF